MILSKKKKVGSFKIRIELKLEHSKLEPDLTFSFKFVNIKKSYEYIKF